MKKVTNIFVVCVMVLSVVSCGTHKAIRNKAIHTPAKTSSKYNRNDIERLSKQFGLRLTQADNLSLYDACSGWLGVKYRYGGNTKKGVDCSGLVSVIYRQVYRVALERNSANILQKNCVAINRNNLREGDLVFFKADGTGKSRIPTHVGIYFKNGKFMHASSSRGVVVSNLSESYYVRNWITGGRVRK
jgi:lipoprotein Spr